VGDEGVRHLLEGHGARDSLGYFALRPDKRAIFSASGKAAVCYGVVGGVSLASGDPLGDPEAWPQAIEAWLAEARRLGLRPAVLGAGRLAAVVYARHGLRVLELGDEAIVELAGFTLEGRAMRVVRQAAARVRRAGYTVTMRRLADVPASDLAELARYAETWRCDSGERGFSMALGRLDGALDPDYLIVEAFDGTGAPRAILGFAPWGVEGLSLDLMRRDRSSDNGLFEFMITELLSRCGGLTVARVSLNFAMFRSTFARAERLGGGPVLHGWCALLRFASRWWQLEQLYRANAKYQPLWVPRFVCYERARDLPAVAVAAAVAEGFLSLPTTGTERVEPVRAH
jgi:lysyl-tRNA synthetase class 2